MSRFRELFPGPLPIIGLIHLPPLPGYPESPGIDSVVQSALDDLRVLEAEKVDGVLVENEYDRPHRIVAHPETLTAMTRVTRTIVERRGDIVVGCEILLNDPKASLAVAHMCGARFIRTDYFVDKMSRPGYGEFAIDPDGLIRYRASINAEDVLILVDIQVKYATMIEARSLSESARLACIHQADAVVVTGDATGDAPTVEHLRQAAEGVRAAGMDVPVLVGSGLTAANAGELLRECGGAIVGTSLMRNKIVDAASVRRIVASVARLR
jgi:membrane complex biogenesis BtpA family protein